MIILPAIDLLGGKAVRLSRGDYNTAKTYSADPASVMAEFVKAGAKEVHIVDLDGAKAGRPINDGVVCQLAKMAQIEVGGGIRTLETAASYVGSGVNRVIFGSAIANDIELVRRGVEALGAAFAAGVDAKNGKVAISGWTSLTSLDSFEFCKSLTDVGVETVIYTDIDTDGMMRGTNLAAFKKLAKLNINVIASGGVTTLDEIRELANMGVYGCILGKALYENKINLNEAIEVAKC